MPSPPLFPIGACSISDDWTYKGMQAVWMENDHLRIGILAGRGSDIFEFYYKPAGLDFMLRLSKDIINPREHFSQIRDTSNQMEDYYYGGWQECLPNSPAFSYRGAALGQHGEVWMIPWKCAVVENRPEEVAVKLWASPLRVPVRIEKTLTLRAGQPTLFIDERLTNTSRTHLDIMWGHHIAFGLPFLREGGRLITNARTMLAEPSMPHHRRFEAGVETEWPGARNISGEWEDASLIPPESAAPYSDLAYLSGFGEKAYYAIRNEEKNIGFSVKWDGAVFRHLWYWQERYATQDAPWWGGAYAIGLEPWTSRFPADAQKAIDAGDWLRLEAGEVLETGLQASAFEGEFES